MRGEKAGSEDEDIAVGSRPVRAALTRFFRRRIENRDEVEDLVQDVFTRIVARDDEEPIRNLAGYIHNVARSVLTDRLRKRQSRRTLDHIEFDAQRHGESDFAPDRILTAQQTLRQVTAALLSLPERTRTIFILERIDGMRQRDIADQLGISVSAVEKHMRRAMRHLSDAVDRDQ